MDFIKKLFDFSGFLRKFLLLISTIGGSIVALIFMAFIISLLLGKGSAFGNSIKKGWKVLAVLILITCLSTYFLRGANVPNAGGGLAVDQNQTIDLNTEDFPISIPIGDNNLKEDFPHNLEYYLMNTKSDTYNSQLSHLMISMCNSVGQENWIKSAMSSLGFPTVGSDFQINYDMKKTLLGYCISVKRLSNDNTIVFVVLRGTGNGDIFSVFDIEEGREWRSNFTVTPDHYGRHSGFSELSKIIYDKIFDCLGKDTDLSKTVFVLTGHSRGGGVANIVAAMLADQRIPQKNIYCYCYACPDTALLKDTDDTYSCIFNIGDVNDFVSWAPRIIMPYTGVSYGFSADTHWNKYGNSYWFSKQNWSNTVSADPIDIGNTHIQNFYLDFLRNEPELDTFKKRNEAFKYIS